MRKYEEPSMEIIKIDGLNDVVTSSATGELNLENIGGTDSGNFSEWYKFQ